MARCWRQSTTPKSLPTLRGGVVSFNAEGSGGALATVTTLATLGMVVPTFTTSAPGPEFSAPQLAFAAVTALALYGLFVAVQTGRHRDYFLPTTPSGEPIDVEEPATPPSATVALPLNQPVLPWHVLEWHRHRSRA